MSRLKCLVEPECRQVSVCLLVVVLAWLKRRSVPSRRFPKLEPPGRRVGTLHKGALGALKSCIGVCSYPGGCASRAKVKRPPGSMRLLALCLAPLLALRLDSAAAPRRSISSLRLEAASIDGGLLRQTADAAFSHVLTLCSHWCFAGFLLRNLYLKLP